MSNFVVETAGQLVVLAPVDPNSTRYAYGGVRLVAVETRAPAFYIAALPSAAGPFL